MKKALLQLSLIIGVFVLTWFLLSNVNWIKIFRIEHATRVTEKKIGDLFWETTRHNEEVIIEPEIKPGLDSIVNRICIANGIKKGTIKLHLIKKNEVNAFALPDDHLIIYTGLIEATQNADELAGVICHEIAHMQLKHIMKKLSKEVGISVLLSMTNNKAANGVIKNALEKLSSTAYDRTLEKEADLKAVHYLANARVSYVPFSNFLNRLTAEHQDIDMLSWISTHPASKERADYVLQYGKGKSYATTPILEPATYKELKEHLKERFRD